MADLGAFGKVNLSQLGSLGRVNVASIGSINKIQVVSSVPDSIFLNPDTLYFYVDGTPVDTNISTKMGFHRQAVLYMLLQVDHGTRRQYR